jgi:hypothetical protein
VPEWSYRMSLYSVTGVHVVLAIRQSPPRW